MNGCEKVMKGLECCAVKNITPESARHCGICPYDRERNGEMDFDCQNDLLCATLELLKEQEPRVMTLQEAINGPQVYFVEFQYHLDRGWVKCDFITHDNVGEVAMLYKDGKTFYQQETTYGRLWRLWNARPTDEQRKATPWEPPKEG